MLELSQTDVAQALGTSVQQIRQYEDGSQQISTDHIDQLSAVLKVPDSFFGKQVDLERTAKDLGSLPFPDHVISFLTSPDGLLLMAAYTQIEDRQIQRCIVQLIEQVARLTNASGPNWVN
jgi:transcriptional regulator with XRE-family HTH domain